MDVAAGNAPDQTEAIAFLSAPESYGSPVNAVLTRQTHGAIVFLAGDRAYKLKRAVRYPYMDYSTVALRRAMCEAELAVNRRTAPDLYLEVRPLVRRPGGAIGFGTRDDADRSIDWVVVMRRFAESDLFEEMRKRGALTGSLARQLADAIATFHARAEIRTDFGGSQGLAAVVDENVNLLRSLAGRPFEAQQVADYTAAVRAEFERCKPLLEKRRHEGHVRRCHGDLHLNNICLFNGKPTLFDAIEFSEDFSIIDTGYDLAFLLMDLEHHGGRDLANEVANRYLERSGDYGMLAALPLFLSCRAALRAHIAATLAEKDAARAAPLRKEACALLKDAGSFLRTGPAVLCAISGLSGTGKSVLAHALAPGVGRAPGAVLLRSDVLRKQLRGSAETERLPEAAYAPAAKALVYETMAARARAILETGHSVIVDAVFGREPERRLIARIARETGARFIPLWLEAPAATLRCRVAQRRGDASDATVAVLEKQLGSIEPPVDWQRIDASGSPEETLQKARGATGLLSGAGEEPSPA